MKLAVIPARGGSKRIPRKNIRDFLGKPIISYTIDAARKAGCFDRIVVSTDDPEIAEVAKDAGAEVPFFRPADLADDYTGTNTVVRHVLEQFRGMSVEFDHACCLYATAPFLTADSINAGLNRLLDADADFAFSVTSFSFPVQRALRRDESGAMYPLYPEHIGSRSQDLEEAFHDAAQFYWGKAPAFLDNASLYGSKSVGIVLPRHRVQDIDTEEDWQRAEVLYQLLQESARR